MGEYFFNLQIQASVSLGAERGLCRRSRMCSELPPPPTLSTAAQRCVALPLRSPAAEIPLATRTTHIAQRTLALDGAGGYPHPSPMQHASTRTPQRSNHLLTMHSQHLSTGLVFHGSVGPQDDAEPEEHVRACDGHCVVARGLADTIHLSPADTTDIWAPRWVRACKGPICLFHLSACTLSPSH
jgi:hypothetical protein